MARLGILGPDGEARFVGWQTPPLPPPDPDPPGTFTHGSQIRRWNVGRPDGFYPQDTRTVIAAPTVQGGTTFGPNDSGRVIENVRFTSNVVIGSGCDNIRFRYCEFDPPASESSGQYTIRLASGAGRVYMDDSNVIGKNARGKSIYLQGTGGIWFRHCLLMGSEDVIHAGPGAAGTPMPWPDYVCEDFTGARIIAEDCWLGDGSRHTAGHVDVFQWDENGGDAVFVRCRMESYSITWPDLPRTHTGTPWVPGNGSVLLTYNQGNGQLGRFGMYDCSFDGGNYTLNLNPGDGPTPLIAAVRRCTFGAEEPFMYEGDEYVGCVRYGPRRGGTHLSGNTWGVTGNILRLGGGGAPTVIAVTAGDPI